MRSFSSSMLLVCFLLTYGCQVGRAPAPVAAFEQNTVAKYPPVSVVLDREQMRTMLAYSDMSDYLVKEFRDSKLFQVVDPYDADNPYTVNIVVNEQYLDSSFELTVKNIINIGSLLLIPINYEISYDATFTFEKENGFSKVYRYTIQSDQIGHISVDTRSSKAEASKVLVSQFLADAQGDNLFERRRF